MSGSLGRRLPAETVGTALLVVFGAGAVIAALQTGNGKLDYAGLGIFSFSFALVIAAAIYMFGKAPRRRVVAPEEAAPAGAVTQLRFRQEGSQTHGR